MLVSFFLTILQFLYMIKFKREIDNYVKSKCLSRRSFACFGGKHRRNVFTMEELVGYEMSLLIFTLVYNILIIYFQFYSDKHYRQMYFIAHNVFYVIFVDFYMLVYVPLKHLTISKQSIWPCSQERKENELRSFYVRNPLESFQKSQIHKNQPRRHFKYGITHTEEDLRCMVAVEI